MGRSSWRKEGEEKRHRKMNHSLVASFNMGKGENSGKKGQGGWGIVDLDRSPASVGNVEWTVRNTGDRGGQGKGCKRNMTTHNIERRGRGGSNEG